MPSARALHYKSGLARAIALRAFHCDPYCTLSSVTLIFGNLNTLVDATRRHGQHEHTSKNSWLERMAEAETTKPIKRTITQTG
jgi:hypothetical protein